MKKAIDLFQVVNIGEGQKAEFPLDMVEPDSVIVPFIVPFCYTEGIDSQEKIERAAEQLLRTVAELNGTKDSFGIIVEADGIRVCVKDVNSLIRPIRGKESGLAVLKENAVTLVD